MIPPTKHQCRFINGDPLVDGKWCGNDHMIASSYCAEHHAICKIPEKQRQKGKINSIDVTIVVKPNIIIAREVTINVHPPE